MCVCVCVCVCVCQEQARKNEGRNATERQLLDRQTDGEGKYILVLGTRAAEEVCHAVSMKEGKDYWQRMHSSYKNWN